jgi:hypothetical protein
MDAGAARELYVYWKTADVQAALAVVHVAQHALCSAEPGLQARALEREGAMPATLMEIYSRRGGIDAALQARIERALAAATNGLVQGEVFVSR